MKRRAFVKSSVAACLTGAAALSRSSSAAEAEPHAREYYELRSYTLKDGKQPLLDDYLSKAFIPALGRFGIGPVGVFTEKADAGVATVHVLIVFRSADQAVALSERLAADEEHQKAGAEYLGAPASDPAYDRIEISLHGAIAAMPSLQKPDTAKPRLLNLRIYESPSERAARKKIEMFNEHELPIFRRVGLNPVFFGETLIGSKMPNLTYMLVFPDDAERRAAWGRFGADDDWKKLKAVPEYADKEIVSHITNKILTPAPYSEI
jgi:NIPSNAP